MHRSYGVAINPSATTPFGKNAEKAGKRWQGGKMDDARYIPPHPPAPLRFAL